MRIISKFKDYYDSASGFGVDTTVVYDRTMQTLPTWSTEADRQNDVRQYRDIKAACEAIVHEDRFAHFYQHSEHKTIFVGIAGKIYVGLALHIHSNDPKKQLWKRSSYDSQLDQLYVWNPENLTDEQLDEPCRLNWGNAKQSKTVREWFTRNREARVVENLELFANHNMVNFVVVRRGTDMDIQLNSQLASVNFQRMMDGFTAFQEISTFVTGVLAQKDQMTHVPTDKELLYARGHDDMSFKTPPTKKR